MAGNCQHKEAIEKQERKIGERVVSGDNYLHLAEKGKKRLVSNKH